MKERDFSLSFILITSFFMLISSQLGARTGSSSQKMMRRSVITTTAVVPTVKNITYANAATAITTSINTTVAGSNQYYSPQERREEQQEISSTSTTTQSKSDDAQQEGKQLPDFHILCYGDSLTAGISPPHEDEFFPYAPHLRRTLKDRFGMNVRVSHLGLPGFTAMQMLDFANEGIVRFIREEGFIANLQHQAKKHEEHLQQLQQKVIKPENMVSAEATAITTPPTIHLLILLAGTNDLFQSKDATPVLNAIMDLHRRAHNVEHVRNNPFSYGNPDTRIFHTLAIGVPSSRFQIDDKRLQQNLHLVNTALENFALKKMMPEPGDPDQNHHRTTYTPFPFDYQTNDPKWADDGLHPTPLGYRVLGEKLAPIVQDILKRYEILTTEAAVRQQQPLTRL